MYSLHVPEFRPLLSSSHPTGNHFVTGSNYVKVVFIAVRFRIVAQRTVVVRLAIHVIILMTCYNVPRINSSYKKAVSILVFWSFLNSKAK